MKRRLVFAILLTLLTLAALATAKDHLAYDSSGAAIFDTLLLPGAFAANIVYPQGIHTGYGAPGWARLVVFSNLAFYILVWYAVLSVVALMRNRQRTTWDAADKGRKPDPQ